MPRQSISPPLKSTVDRVYQTIAQQSNARTPELETTRGVRFFAEAKQATDGRRFDPSHISRSLEFQPLAVVLIANFISPNSADSRDSAKIRAKRDIGHATH